MVPRELLTEVWKALELRVKAANVPKHEWAQQSQRSTWEFGGKWETGQERMRA
jgi:hypothetical protein